jgi:hypothetical protein
VYGDKAALEARFSRDSASRWSGYEQHTIARDYGAVSNKIASRHAKTTLLRHLPYVDDMLYLDADTRVNGKIDHVFGMLDDGWDVVMTASTNQDTDLMWHLPDAEAETTLTELGYLPLALQCGVMWVRRSPLTEAFWEVWHEEWMRYANEDQGAFLRALNRVPLRIWLLGRPFNGGAVIEHRFGMVRT